MVGWLILPIISALTQPHQELAEVFCPLSAQRRPSKAPAGRNARQGAPLAYKCDAIVMVEPGVLSCR